MAKMTKKEAVEMLKNRKVMVTPSESRKVQEKLFELGFRWDSCGTKVSHIDCPFLFIWDDMTLANSFYFSTFRDSSKFRMTAEEILSIEIVEDYVPKFGDIVRVDSPRMGTKRYYYICIMPDKEIPEHIDNDFFDIANVNKGVFLSFSCGYNIDLRLSPASESEKQELFDKLAEVGKRWNAEKKCLEDIPQELNLCEILKDCPKGTKFYTDVFGDVFFHRIKLSNISDYPVWFKKQDGGFLTITKEGYFLTGYPNCGCVVFPSKEQRDWSKWVCPKPDLPIDTPVMVSDEMGDWALRYYAGNKETWVMVGQFEKSTSKVGDWNHIIPFDKFNPNDIEESLKHDICKE